MKTVAAGKFKDQCLRILDDVAETRVTVLITKRGRAVAKLIPVNLDRRGHASLVGSVLGEEGDPFSTGESWNDDAR